METSWVMTETERIALWKSRLSKHRKTPSGPRRSRLSNNSISESDGSTNDELRNQESSDGGGTSPGRSQLKRKACTDDDIEEKEDDI